MERREFKDFIYQAFSSIGKTLSSPKRIELLDLLTQGRKSVETLASETDMSVANTSKHLQSLFEAKLVRYTKAKNHVYYELASEEVRNLVLALRKTAEDRISDVNGVRQDYITRKNKLKTVSLADVKTKLDKDAVILIDVRPKDEYGSDHLPGAISVPLAQLEGQLSSLPEDKPVIAYCRGPYCVYATEAVERLQEKGYDAMVLDAGINEWKQIDGAGV
ncbi:ArsR/SmtB family transcription factor [Salipaludibacillus aurantiacus]|uniref:Rhodanese-related sulfurtransferase n=1 Tax=Salipaludibacillus aurantiacus TaxID=1601833 RepID=A0A1H9UUV6_9BACI|nr:metalloregulator ArsR/SmtB family transcription factor [Salipaludibacillus aurantiacus]SES12773.1 Rhodanese-related sulfurtransferase [Salipaludibacillus aurantiacus]